MATNPSDKKIPRIIWIGTAVILLLLASGLFIFRGRVGHNGESGSPTDQATNSNNTSDTSVTGTPSGEVTTGTSATGDAASGAPAGTPGSGDTPSGATTGAPANGDAASGATTGTPANGDTASGATAGTTSNGVAASGATAGTPANGVAASGATAGAPANGDAASGATAGSASNSKSTVNTSSATGGSQATAPAPQGIGNKIKNFVGILTGSKQAGSPATPSGTSPGPGTGTGTVGSTTAANLNEKSAKTGTLPAVGPSGTQTAQKTLGTPAITGAQTAAIPATPVVEEKKEPVMTEGCVTVTYHHKSLASHGSEESCSRHQNLIKIKQPNYIAGSVCIRVNKSAVAYQTVKGKPGEFLVPAVAGPKAVITARYCVGHATCKEDCTVPKDEFLDSIGGSDREAKNFPVAQWDPSDANDKDTQVNGHLSGELKKELDDYDNNQAATTVFKDWISGTESPSCGVKQAFSEQSRKL